LDDYPNDEHSHEDLGAIDDLIIVEESLVNDELPELPESSELAELLDWVDLSSESAVLGKSDLGDLNLASGAVVSGDVEGTRAIDGGTDAGGAISNPSPVGIPFLVVPVALLVLLKGMFPGNGARVHARQFKK